MKRKNKNLEKNISRLIKQLGDSDEPCQNFRNSLIDSALNQLQHTQPGEERDNAMKFNWKTTFALAASILIIAAVAVFFTLTHLNKTQSTTPIIVASGKTADTPSAGNLRPCELQYTQREAELVAKAPPASVPAPERPQIIEDAKKQVLALGGDKSEAKIAGRAGNADMYKLGYEVAADATLSEAMSRGKALSSNLCLQPAEPGQYPMAHGGTTPPNDEAVDAMFFKNYGVNPFIDTEDDHLSTFATDVDTGSYTVARQYLNQGNLPPNDAVRVEEFVNYFDYGYPAPQKDTFAVYTEAAPWQFDSSRKNSHLLRVALKAQKIAEENRKPAVLTFVIDVSGSMSRENRLGLVKKSLRMLVERLKANDRIGIAVYGTQGRKILDHKGLDQKDQIIAAIESLHPEGSTNAEEGIRIGYDMADAVYTAGSINRVILCSDGVANVGRTGPESIFEMIKEKAEKGVTLSTLGFGMGNYNDVLMERLGDKGNGSYAYIDNITAAERLFKDNLTGTLQVVARDVKIQVDFNPDVVRSYRLIGYENRDVPDDKFRDDKWDGGEIGAGHSATALYEIKLWPDKTGTVATTYVRYKHPETRQVTEFKSSFSTKDFSKDLAESSDSFKLAAVVGEFAEILRKSYWAKDAKLETVLEHAGAFSGEIKNQPDVIELTGLISKAAQLEKQQKPSETAGNDLEPAPLEYTQP
ncbi:MAG: von Willebrand factor type A domain-containing protein [Planctomycetota bacterium]